MPETHCFQRGDRVAERVHKGWFATDFSTAKKVDWRTP